MSARFVLKCSVCQQASREVGNDRLGFCPCCKQLANAVRPQHRPLDDEVCSECGSEQALRPLTREGQPVGQPHREDGMDCPWCGGIGTLSVASFSIVNQGLAPLEAGERLQCRIIGRDPAGYVASVDPFRFVVLSGGGELYTWCEAVQAPEFGQARFERRLGPSGDVLLDQLEVSYQDEPCLLFDVGRIARRTAQDPLRNWDLWRFTIGRHTHRQPPAPRLTATMRMWTLEFGTLCRLGAEVASFVKVWDRTEREWVSFDGVHGLLAFPGGRQVEWRAPWDTSAALLEGLDSGSTPSSLTLRSQAGRVLWRFGTA